jgi:ATP-dependent Clp protease ATP-binding subunit ClpC
MFEKYTEKARRVIFFARYEASQYGSKYIEIPHLLLGLMREDRMLFSMLGIDFTTVREAVGALCTKAGEPIATTVDLPLSHQCRRALGYAVEEAQLTSYQQIGTGHLLLGVLREGGEACSCLGNLGITLDRARAALVVAGLDASEPSPVPQRPTVSSNRQAAIRLLMQLPEDRMEAVVHVLSGLSSEFITLAGSTASGRFEFSFGKPPAAADA